VDRLTKETYFILYKERSNAEEMSYAFSKKIVKRYRTLEEIITNKDKLFALKF
jgi:hypothetical protein